MPVLGVIWAVMIIFGVKTFREIDQDHRMFLKLGDEEIRQHDEQCIEYLAELDRCYSVESTLRGIDETLAKKVNSKLE